MSSDDVEKSSSVRFHPSKKLTSMFIVTDNDYENKNIY